MPMTVRLSPVTERALNAMAKRRQVSRSDIVREALEQYGKADGGADHTRPYDAWADVIGAVSLGPRDATRTTGEQFAAVVAGKARARRSR